MSYQALYRKWRPTTFEDVVGQEHITTTLKNEIISSRIAHAYLFTGIRGTGKTSTAKIFSRAVNCLNSQDGNPCNECAVCKGILDGSVLDVVEMDAASNNKVENAREILDEIIYPPTTARYKVYIIDEVHMLTTSAFNALLKTLEEPPAHVIFILATTEIHKIPATILSRCQRFDFRRITAQDVIGRLKEITQADQVEIEERALDLIANLSEGSMRDALSILDRAMAYGEKKITYQDAVNILGIADDAFTSAIAKAIGSADTAGAVLGLDEALQQGKAASQIVEGLLKCFRNLLMTKLVGDPASVIELTKERIEELSQLAQQFTQEKLVNCIQVLSSAQNDMKFSSNPRVILELAVIKMCLPMYDESTEALMDRLSTLEKKIKEGVSIASLPPREEKEPQPQKEPEKIVFTGPYYQKWKEILEEIKKSSMAVWATLSSVKAMGEGDCLTILFPDDDTQGLKEFICEEANRVKLFQAIEAVCGRAPIRLEFESVSKEDIEYNDKLKQLEEKEYTEIMD